MNDFARGNPNYQNNYGNNQGDSSFVEGPSSSNPSSITVPSELPPCSIEHEMGVLGRILVEDSLPQESVTSGNGFKSTRLMDIAVSILQPDYFFIRKHQLIYRAMLTLYNQGFPTDLLSVSTQLQATHDLDYIGGLEYLTQLAVPAKEFPNFEGYCNTILDRFQRRSTLSIKNKIDSLVYEYGMPFEEALNHIETELNLLRSHDRNRATLHNSEVAGIAFADLDKDLTLLHTGYHAIDKLIIGLEASTLTVLAGRPSMGKSAFAMALALQITSLHNRSVVYYSMEMTKEQLEYRMWSALSVHPHFADWGLTPIDAMRIRQHFIGNKLNPDECKNLVSILNLATTIDVYINEERGITPEGIRADCKRVRSQSSKPLGLIIIDYLQLFDKVGSTASEVANEVARITRSFFKLAKEMDCPVLLLSQVGRGCESRNDKRPMMSDLAQSGAIEQIADQILFCYRDSYYNRNSQDDNVEIIVAKARHGDTGIAQLGFDKKHQLFYNLTNPIYL